MRRDLDSLYRRARAVLWVEDPETKGWLDRIWFGALPAIEVLVARGRDGVEAVSRDAYVSGHTHVFGLVDRDFGTSNRHMWSSMATDQRVYRLHVSEFDNLLLSDVDALMGCSSHIHNRDRADVENRIENEAQKRIWWVTCIRFLAETKMKSREGYPADPNFSAIQSQQAAEQYVLNALWFKNTALHCPSLVDPTTVSQELAAMHGIVNKQFTSGTWRQEFPGKEIFKAIATYLNGQNSGLDFYKSVGDWQREHAKQTGAPLPLADLRQSILTRIGIVTPAPP